MSKKTAHILIIDDEAIMRLLTTRILTNAGHRVTTAATGAEGLQLAQTEAPDLVLLDVVLPDIDGVEVCRRIKATPGLSTPHVVLLSGSRVASAEQALGLESGADGYITRPIANRELLARVEAMLRLQDLEQQLREQERIAAVGQLASGLAHNLNSILQSMLLRSELTARDATLSMQTKRSLAQLTAETKKAAALVQQLLDFSRQAVMQPAVVDLAELVQDTARSVEREIPPAVTLRLALAVAEANVWGDAVRLRQLLLNLVRNAVDALAQGGRLTIALRFDVATGACTSCHETLEGSWVQLAVCDDGAGMNAQVAGRAFEPFFSTRVPQHRGLGLSQALGIVKQHDGHITLQSEPGSGTTVTVFLPPHGG